MKKLLQINPVIRTSTSTGRIMQEIGSMAVKRGWESHIAYSRGRDGIKESRSHIIPVGSGIDVISHALQTRLLDRHGLASRTATRDFINKVQSLSPDIIHIHNIHGYFLNYRLLFEFLALTDIPVVWTIHDCWLFTGHCYHYTFAGCDRWQSGCHHCPQKHKFPATYGIDRSRRNYADKLKAFTSVPPGRMTLVTVSQWLRGEIQRSFLRDYPVEVIRNGVDTGIFRPQTDSRTSSPISDTAHKKIVLGVAGIWSREKGLDDFISLASVLPADYRIVLAGIDKTTARRLPAAITALPRTADTAALSALYSAATVFVNPTYQDNYPTVNLEAMACGTPVVTYRTGGSTESITPATGASVEPGDINGLAEAIIRFAEADPAATCSACRSHALASFDKDLCYGHYFDLYNRVLTHH